MNVRWKQQSWPISVKIYEMQSLEKYVKSSTRARCVLTFNPITDAEKSKSSQSQVTEKLRKRMFCN